MVLRNFSFLPLIVLLIASCNSEPPVNEDGTPDAGRLYNIHCAGCHKPDGTGGIAGAKNLTTTVLSFSEIENVIKNGRGDMMPFSNILNDAEIQGVAKYVHSFQQ